MTAVEWLWEQIDNTIPFQNIQTSQIFNGLLNQAKQMEKEQIIDAYKQGQYDSEPIRETDAEQYYNQTYESHGIALQNNPQSKVITELSDEEIEQAAKEYDIKSTRWGAKTIFIDAVKWYREQLKKKQ